MCHTITNCFTWNNNLLIIFNEFSFKLIFMSFHMTSNHKQMSQKFVINNSHNTAERLLRLGFKF